MKDLLYYFDKGTLEKHELGEVQSGFNMSIVIDGTKDSSKMEVFSFNGNTLEPQTIIWHEKTNTWWIVSHDKVERHKNEIGYLYIHNLQLEGAIELLNARDLTTCGFYQNRYTIGGVIQRLFEMSNFELPVDTLVISSLRLDTSLNVDYIKTFENYTLLSAIREFLDGYNACAKLQFIVSGSPERITGYILNIISKTGTTYGTTIDESRFNDVKEIKTMDKNSFGTSVVSNAENVITTKSKEYPTLGFAKLSANALEITSSSALLRLPSNIGKIEYMKIRYDMSININYQTDYNIVVSTEAEVQNQLNDIAMEQANNLHAIDVILPVETIYNRILYHLEKDRVVEKIMKAATITLYTGWRYNPISKNFVKPDNNKDFYFPTIRRVNGTTPESTHNWYWLLGTKDEHDGVSYPERVVYYEKGNDVVNNFSVLPIDGVIANNTHLTSYTSTDYRSNQTQLFYHDIIRELDPNFVGSTSALRIMLGDVSNNDLTLKNTYYKVKYIPASDLKIKYDNSSTSNDVQLYNQNGKLTDGVALSKSIISYSKEIESDTITKYGNYNSYAQIPSVGSIVIINNEPYVINNVSIDFYQNENTLGEESVRPYFCACEFTMSKKVSVKSLMVNPNTNIRDYGIPQNNNVVRKQLYRDFYELTHARESTDYSWYLPLYRVFNYTVQYRKYQEHVAVIKLQYNQPYGGENGSGQSDTWYYQLDTTTYNLKKSIYEVVNFKDNNIIGYGSQNVTCGFDITRIFTGMTDIINTPISYVDDNGEVKSVSIAFSTSKQIQNLYDTYKNNQSGGSSYNKALYNYSVFIPSDIYEGNENYSGDLLLAENIMVSNYGSFPTRIDLSPYIRGYEYLDPNRIEIENVVLSDEDVEFTYVINKVGSRLLLLLQYPNGNIGTGNCVVNIYNLKAVSTTLVGAKVNNDFLIEEENYKKDALEVPFFEYSCQLDDSDDVLIGENIFESTEDDSGYLYQYAFVDKNTCNENYWYVAYSNQYLSVMPNQETLQYDVDVPKNNTFSMQRACLFEVSDDGKELYISAFNRITLVDNGDVWYGEMNDFDADLFATKDLVITRVPINNQIELSGDSSLATITKTKPELVMVVKNLENAIVDDNDRIVIQINHYRLK